MMKKNSVLLLIIKIYAVVLSIFSVFRIILFFTEINRVDFNDVKIITIFKAFVMGIRFDIVITGYIIFIPTLILLILYLFKKRSAIIEKIVFYWIFLLFSLAFIISAVDIPYFNQFFSRLSVGAFEWFDNFGFVFRMIYQEPKYFLIAIPTIIFIIGFFKILQKIFLINTVNTNSNIFVKIVISILLLLVIFIGIRGRIEQKSPIRIGTAYFSNHAFLNQLGLNPVFTLLRSYLDTKSKKNAAIKLMDSQIAVAEVQKSLGIVPDKFSSPIARKITYDTLVPKKANVVVIIMESMSAAKMKRHGNPNGLTPFLDSISNHSLYFENIYTAGKHTFNGIFGTLFSFPSLYRQQPLKNIKKYNGIGSVLQKNGYSTTYFTTHDSQFDNVEGFLRANNYENIISQANYPISEVKTTLGVPDDFMFRYSIPTINKLSADGKPFFVSLMTVSDHGPYYIPEYFTPNNTDVKLQIVEYADWSLKKFITLASHEPWFDNTIFVFIADHGAPLSAPYDISLDYHHSPLIIYAPKLFPTSKTYECIGGQIDVFPTIMGLLNQTYVNNTLGIDLLNEKRPFIFVNDDDKIGVINDSLFLIMKENEKPKLYKYRNNDKKDYSTEYPIMVSSMMNYTKANMQTFQYMLKNNYTYEK